MGQHRNPLRSARKSRQTRIRACVLKFQRATDDLNMILRAFQTVAIRVSACLRVHITLIRQHDELPLVFSSECTI